MLALCSYLLSAPSMIIFSCGPMISWASSLIRSVSIGRRLVSSSLDRVNAWQITSRSYVLSTGRNAKRINKGKVTWDNCEWGNSVKMTFERYNFASTLVIEMYLGKHAAYSILNTSQAHLAAAILPCCNS